MNDFLAEQAEKYRCPNYGDFVSVHDGKCYSCGYTTKNPKPKSIEKARQLSAKKQLSL